MKRVYVVLVPLSLADVGLTALGTLPRLEMKAKDDSMFVTLKMLSMVGLVNHARPKFSGFLDAANGSLAIVLRVRTSSRQLADGMQWTSVDAVLNAEDREILDRVLATEET